MKSPDNSFAEFTPVSRCSSRVLVFVPCSSRKRLCPEPSMRAQNLHSGEIEQVARDWGKRITNATPQLAQEQVYLGRTYSEGRAAARCLNAELIVVSAGYGFVSEQDTLAPYDLTVALGENDFIGHKILNTDWSPDIWWRALREHTCANTDLTALLTKVKPDLVLMALSTRYTQLIADELRQLTLELKMRLRIFCAGTISQVLPTFSENVMPFDARLDGPDSPIRGTMSDYSSRALHYYARLLRDGLIKGENIEDDRADLVHLMANWALPIKKLRKRQTDDEIMEFIVRNWKESRGRSTISLRMLRDSGRACEQSRFNTLFQRVAIQQEPYKNSAT